MVLLIVEPLLVALIIAGKKMTYNSIITTGKNSISSSRDFQVTGSVAVDDTFDNKGIFTVKGNATIGNSSLDKFFINSDLILKNGLTVTTASISNDLSFCGGTLYIDSNLRNVGINTTTPSADLHVVGTTLIEGNITANVVNEIDSVNKRVGIGTNGFLNTYSSEYKFIVFNGDAVFGTDNNVYFKNTTSRVGFNTNNPLARLHIVKPGLSVANKIVDPNTTLLLEGTGKVVAQISSATGTLGYNNSCGFLFTASPTTIPNGPYQKNVAIFANWDGSASPADPTISTPTQNDLSFGFTDSNSSTPFYDCTQNCYAFLRDNVIVNQIDFTGQHRSLPSINDLDFYEDKTGLIVVSDGTYCKTLSPYDGDETISINEAIPKVKLSSKRNDKAVFGVISNKEDSGQTRSYMIGKFGSVFNKRADDHRLIINSLGEGAIWVCNINGNLENGDYITSCEIPGYGMKQDSELLMNYTVAKITCDCDFDLDSDIYECHEFEFNGVTYRKAFVGCTYHCG